MVWPPLIQVEREVYCTHPLRYLQAVWGGEDPQALRTRWCLRGCTRIANNPNQLEEVNITHQALGFRVPATDSRGVHSP